MYLILSGSTLGLGIRLAPVEYLVHRDGPCYPSAALSFSVILSEKL